MTTTVASEMKPKVGPALNSRISLWLRLTARNRFVATATTLATTTSGVALLVGVDGALRMTLRGDLAPVALVIMLPLLVMAWVAVVLLPLQGATMLIEGGRFASIRLAVGAVSNSLIAVGLVTVGGGGAIAGFAVAALSVSPTLAAALPSRRHGERPVSASRMQPHPFPKVTLRTTRLLLWLGGPLGLHTFYLRRAWQGVIYLTVVALGFLSWGFAPAWFFAFVAVFMMVVDYFASSRDVCDVNDRLIYEKALHEPRRCERRRDDAQRSQS